jgi:hypothetical protein
LFNIRKQIYRNLLDLGFIKQLKNILNGISIVKCITSPTTRDKHMKPSAEIACKEK